MTENIDGLFQSQKLMTLLLIVKFMTYTRNRHQTLNKFLDKITNTINKRILFN